MGVEDDGARGFRREQFAENDRAAAGNGEEMRFDAARFEHFDETRRVPLNIGRVGGHVRNGEKLREFADDAVLIVHTVVAHFEGNLSRRPRSYRGRWDWRRG